MDLFSEQFARSERAALEHHLARGEVLSRHLAAARPIRRWRWLRTRGWRLLAFRRRPTAPAPTVTVRGAAPSPSP